MFLTLALIAGPGLAMAGEEKKKGGGITFVQMSTLTATVLRGDGHRGVMTVEVGVDIPDGALRAKAQISLPRLRAAYIQMLQAYASGLGPGGAPDADYIARVLQKETDRVLGKPGGKLLLGTILVN
ncbi:MAG: Tat pathway signal protein [Caulobacteraceae bacterium]|nr:Tat pathway signal protein [Caulobacteraceae bacterium]